jgi:hypothetical protein
MLRKPEPDRYAEPSAARLQPSAGNASGPQHSKRCNQGPTRRLETRRLETGSVRAGRRPRRRIPLRPSSFQCRPSKCR